MNFRMKADGRLERYFWTSIKMTDVNLNTDGRPYES